MTTAQHLSPLQWPIGWARARHRSRSQFRSGIHWPSVAETADDLTAELARLGAREIVITTNLPVSRGGRFNGEAAMPYDVGASVFFRVDGNPRALACDKWLRVACNLRAISKHVEAIRGQARWGCGSIEQALGGYKLLTALDAPKLWYEVLGLPPSASWAEVERRRAVLLAQHHPDRGGAHAQAADINRAFDEARRAFGESA